MKTFKNELYKMGKQITTFSPKIIGVLNVIWGIVYILNYRIEGSMEYALIFTTFLILVIDIFYFKSKKRYIELAFFSSLLLALIISTIVNFA